MVYGTYNELVTGAYKSTFTSRGGGTLYQRLKFTNFAASQFEGSTMRYLIYCCWSLDSFYSHVPWHVLDLSPTVCYLNPQWIPKKFKQTKNVCFVELKFTIFHRKMSIRNPQKSSSVSFPRLASRPKSWTVRGWCWELSEHMNYPRLVTARGWYYPGWKWE